MAPSHASALREVGGEALTGGVQAGLLSSEIHPPPGCRPCSDKGKAARFAAIARVAYWTRGVREPRHVRKLLARKPGGPRSGQLHPAVGPVGEGPRPSSRHARDWEVGHGNSIDEANEQRCSTAAKWPTTSGVRGEKDRGRGES